VQSGAITLAQKVASDMHIYFDETNRSVVWVYADEGITHTFSLVFHNEQLNDTFKQDISRFLWETNTVTPFAKVGVRPYGTSNPPFCGHLCGYFVRLTFIVIACRKTTLIGSWALTLLRSTEWKRTMASKVRFTFTKDGLAASRSPFHSLSCCGIDFDQMEFVDDKKQESAAEKEEEEEEEETQPEEEDDSDDEEEDVPEQDKNAKNSALAVGYKYDRSFVVRGSQIGVFKHTPDNRLKFSTTIKNVRTPSGQRFQPRKYVILSRAAVFGCGRPE
jgi:hypothetical protein